jgi:urea transport system substrate-binding protein
MNRRFLVKALALAASVAAIGMAPAIAQQKTIKVGVLHSLSGTMAISETVLKDTALMAFDEINAAGGVMGMKIEPVVVDPASNWPLFAEKARQLITQDKVSVVFGCWTSVSRKSVLPVFEELNSLLFYPVQYEGEEISRNVFYTGAAPNQQAIPAVEYLMSKDGGAAKRWFLLGTDYVYPRTTNKILRAFLKSKGVADKDIEEIYTPFGHSDYQTIVANIKKFSAGGKTAVVSTINGDSNVPFYKELGNQEVGGLCQGEEHRRAQGQAADQRPDGSHLHRRAHVEAGGREGEELRCRQGDRGDGRPDLHGALGHHLQDGREEPPPLQGGVHRRGEGRRPVQRRVEDQGAGQGPALEPVHRGQRQEEGRARADGRQEDVTCAQG